jgi:hypothetical protein
VCVTVHVSQCVCHSVCVTVCVWVGRSRTRGIRIAVRYSACVTVHVRYLKNWRAGRGQPFVFRHCLSTLSPIRALLAPRIEVIVGAGLRPVAEVLALAQRHISDQERHLPVPLLLDDGMVHAAGGRRCVWCGGRVTDAERGAGCTYSPTFGSS